MTTKNNQHLYDLHGDNDSSLYLYTDGSNQKDFVVYGGAAVIRNNKILRFQRCGTYLETAQWNVSGEMMAIYFGLELIKELDDKHVVIVHDYEGVEKWLTGEWQLSRKSGIWAIKAKEKYDELIEAGWTFEFKHIYSHTGCHCRAEQFNSAVDLLAKEGKLEIPEIKSEKKSKIN